MAKYQESGLLASDYSKESESTGMGCLIYSPPCLSFPPFPGFQVSAGGHLGHWWQHLLFISKCGAWCRMLSQGQCIEIFVYTEPMGKMLTACPELARGWWSPGHSPGMSYKAVRLTLVLPRTSQHRDRRWVPVSVTRMRHGVLYMCEWKDDLGLSLRNPIAVKQQDRSIFPTTTNFVNILENIDLAGCGRLVLLFPVCNQQGQT